MSYLKIALTGTLLVYIMLSLVWFGYLIAEVVIG